MDETRTDVNINLDEIKTDVNIRLEFLGYTVKSEDLWMIEFAVKKALQSIKNTCNRGDLPCELSPIAVDMACGEFLLAMKQIGKLDEAFHLERAIKRVEVGDTDITFDLAQSPEKRLDSLIDYLVAGKAVELVCYRKIKW